MTDTKPASEISVFGFRQIFQWPLFLDRTHENMPISQAVAEAERSVEQSPQWQHIPDALDQVPQAIRPDDGTEDTLDGGPFGEFVYFHDFTQSFLYPSGENSLLKVYRRTDLVELRARVSGATHVLSIERLSLHLFRTGVAVLTLELAFDPSNNPHQLTLAETQRVIDYLRRSYASYWIGDAPGRTPELVELVAKDGVTTASTPFDRATAVAGIRSTSRDVCVFDHWRDLVHPLTLKCHGGLWRDPSDERIPCLSFISLTNPDLEDGPALNQIADCDWVRIADAEEPGDHYPYNPDFLKEFKSTAFYDRFLWCERSPGVSVRHLFGGTHYAVVGAGWFFDNILVHHFRRHYTQLALIARFQMATLLAFSSRLTAAVEARDNAKSNGQDGSKEFERDVLQLQDDFLSYIHRFHFTGVSSQVQPAEMWDRWRATLGLDALHNDVKNELENASAAIHAQQDKRFSENAERLTNFATYGVIFGLIFAILSLSPPGQTTSDTTLVESWRHIGIVAALVGAGSLLVNWILRGPLHVTIVSIGITALGLISLTF